MAKLTQLDLLDLNKTFEQRTPQELIRWAADIFGDRIAVLSSMQKAGTTVCHMVSRLRLGLPVLFVDTGVLFPETLATRDRVAAEYELDVKTLHPRQTMIEQTAERGVLYLSVEGQQECCHKRKVEPLYAVKGEYDCLVGSLRRTDGGRRAVCPFVAVDPEMNMVRVNPLAGMDQAAFDAYRDEHAVITNPLHEQGYATIGCNRCTTPVMPYEDRRAGRWRHLGSMAQYCGINPTDLDPYSSPAVDLPQSLIDRILGRETDFVI